MGSWFSSSGDELLISALSHFTVIDFYRNVLVGNSYALCVVTELLHSDLESLLIRDQTPIPLIRRLEMALGAALGMNWLHQSKPRIIHRDLKLSNLVFYSALYVLVA